MMKTRSLSDRVRHALMFEAIGLMIIIPASAALFNKPMTHMGVVGIGSATIATVWNFTFNIGFDRCMRKMYGHIRKSLKARLLHTVLFEAGLLLILLPLIAWYLNMTLLDTLVLDLAIVVFYLVYNFVFNVAYDRFFPVMANSRPQVVSNLGEAS
ncbi:PACE efflux transporter [Comamonas sp. A7-5]|uniref:PACE efflux transporter n=1 Tax=Comamonas sp. A7-5 TaxID=673549 RepID=UPI0031E1B9B0